MQASRLLALPHCGRLTHCCDGGNIRHPRHSIRSPLQSHVRQFEGAQLLSISFLQHTELYLCVELVLIARWINSQPLGFVDLDYVWYEVGRLTEE